MRLAVSAERLALPRALHHADDVAREIELHDLAAVAVREPDVAVSAHAQAARRAGVAAFANGIAVGVEHLDARVVAVGDVKQPLRVEHQRMRQVELARSFAGATPGGDEIAVAVELVHAGLGLAVALQHVDVARGADHRLVRLVEGAQVAEGMPAAAEALHAEHHLDAAGRIELVDEVRRDIGRPDVVVRVDAQAVRPLEQAVAETADEVAVGVEFHQRHRPAMDDVDVAPGVEGDARRAAEIHAGGEMEGVSDGDVGKRWGHDA